MWIIAPFKQNKAINPCPSPISPTSANSIAIRPDVEVQTSGAPLASFLITLTVGSQAPCPLSVPTPLHPLPAHVLHQPPQARLLASALQAFSTQ